MTAAAPRLALLLPAIVVALVSARYAHENEIIGQPEILCSERAIGVAVRTANPYFGRIFVNGRSADPYCIKRFNSKQSKGALEIPIGACEMRVERTFQPYYGVEYGATMVVSFHSDLLTETDRVFHVKCRYFQTDRSIGSFFEVGILPTAVLTSTYPLPNCRYTLHSGSINGPPAQFARIGDLVYHKWSCDTDAYAIKVKRCYVDDGHKLNYLLIDDDGCATDKNVLPELKYEASLRTAFVRTHVFKFADRPQVYFRCQVTLCFKATEPCYKSTPPICTGLRYRSRRSVVGANSTADESKVTQSEEEEEEDVALASPTLVVIDIADSKKLASYMERSQRSTCALCVAQPGFVLLVTFNLLTLLLATAATVALCRRRPDTLYLHKI